MPALSSRSRGSAPARRGADVPRRGSGLTAPSGAPSGSGEPRAPPVRPPVSGSCVDDRGGAHSQEIPSSSGALLMSGLTGALVCSHRFVAVTTFSLSPYPRPPPPPAHAHVRRPPSRCTDTCAMHTVAQVFGASRTLALRLPAFKHGGKWASSPEMSIKTWSDLWRSTGPKSIATSACLVASFAIAGAVRPHFDVGAVRE